MFQQLFGHLLQCDLWEQEMSAVISMEVKVEMKTRIFLVLSLFSPIGYVRCGDAKELS